MPTDVAGWKPVFDFLEHEAKFQAAAAGITGAAAAWWLKALLTPPSETNKPQPPGPHRAARAWAALLLTAAAFCFFVDQGRIAARYGVLARAIVFGTPIPGDFPAGLVRDVYNGATWRAWYPYYAARLLLLGVGAIVAWLLWETRDKSTDGRLRRWWNRLRIRSGVSGPRRNASTPAR
jgi:hypothetical protein